MTSFVKPRLDLYSDLGKGRHGLFTIAVIKVLESEEGRGTTYEGLVQIIGCLRDPQIDTGGYWNKEDICKDVPYLPTYLHTSYIASVSRGGISDLLVARFSVGHGLPLLWFRDTARLDGPV